MNPRNSSLSSLSMLIVITIAASLAHAQDRQVPEMPDTVMVGRISYIEGQLLRYDPESDDWAATTHEAPFGIDDLLHTEADSKAEFIMPNNTWARIDSDTRIQLVALDHGHTRLDLALGTARLINKSTETEIVATTPFGIVSAPPGSAFDLVAQENGVEVIAIREKVYFVHNASRNRHEISSDAAAIFADTTEVTATPGDVAYSWGNWNRDMDELWAARLDARGESAAYLPPTLHSEAYALDTHGRWDRVYYDGAYYRFWRPVHVSAGWAPFTYGAWMVWHGDHVWIPSEPFGYVTHHYGNWIFTAGFWYWAPPVTRVMIHAHLPLLRIGFGWYPGRVGWILSGAHIGWIPLAPHEPYYTHRHWGRRSTVVAKGARFNRDFHHFKHHRHAVVIHRNHLYRSSNYSHVRVRHISGGTIGNAFRTAPVLNTAVIKDSRSMTQKDRFKPTHRTHRPQRAVARNNKKDRRLYATSTPAHQRQRPTGQQTIRPGQTRRQPARVTQAKTPAPAKRIKTPRPLKKSDTRTVKKRWVRTAPPKARNNRSSVTSGPPMENRRARKTPSKPIRGKAINSSPTADRRPRSAYRPSAGEGQKGNTISNRSRQPQGQWQPPGYQSRGRTIDRGASNRFFGQRGRDHRTH